ncbi:MAG: hypothetical protein JNJ61_03845 [Anaerolineae bacterium]|nr:hypothetical protein [Anaerolineae bacterium]
MIKRHLPHTAIGTNNPLFNLEIKRVRFAETPDRLARYTRWALVVGTVIVTLVMAGILESSRGYITYALGESVLFRFVVIGVLAEVVLDIACMVGGLGVVRNEITISNAMLGVGMAVRLSNIVAAKHALVQARAWRVMVLVIALRLGVMIVFLLDILSYGALLTDLSVLLPLAVMGILSVIYLIEPFWRMSAVSAVSLMISTYIHNRAVAFLAAFFAIVLLWTVLIVIVAALMWISTLAGIAIICLPISFFGFIGGIWIFYRWLREWALGRTRLRLHNLD